MSELFLTVFNTAVTAGWLVLAVLAARLLLKNAPAWAKCALWAVVGIRLVWPFEIESVLSLVPSAQTLPPAALYTDAPQIHTGIAALNSTINPTFTQTFQPEPAASVNPLQVVVAVASILWLAGIVVMLGYALGSYLRLRRRVRISMPVGEGVYLCDAIASPFILGIIKPKIYLPSDLTQEKWQDILSHERAHLARRDHWWKPLGFVLLTIFWFHPLLWVAYVLLCRDVERACDEKVIKTLSTEEKQNYSQTLLECSLPRKWITACPLAFGETGVKGRIKAVLHYKKPALWVIIAALVLCTVLTVCFLTDPVTDQPVNHAVMLFDRDVEDSPLQGEVELDGFRGVSVRWSLTPNLITSEEKPVLVKDGEESVLFENYPPPTSLYLADITGDGKQDLCAEVFFLRSGLPSFNAVCVYDIVNDCYYMLSDAANTNHYTKVSYYLRLEEGKLVCDKVLEYDGSLLLTGTLFLADTGEHMTLCLEPLREPITAADVAGKVYCYEADDYRIWINEDGTFFHLEAGLSSTTILNECYWELEDGKLYLHEGGKTFVFRVERDALVYLAEESDSFMMVDVADGERFIFYCEIDRSNAITNADLAGKHFVCHYERELDTGTFTDWFTLMLREDGTCWYHTSGLSSQIHDGTWSLEDGKLHIQYESPLGSAGVASFEVQSDSTLCLTSPFIILSEGAIFEMPQSKLVWVEEVELNGDTLAGIDGEGTCWRVFLTEQMTRRDLENIYGGVWVSYYGPPLAQEDGTYEVTATACWKYVEDEAILEGKDVHGWIYDYRLYDFDNDNTAEECIISMGWTSGICTVYFSTWENGACETGVLIQVDHALGYAFGIDDCGLYIISSEGKRYYPGLYSGGMMPGMMP